MSDNGFSDMDEINSFMPNLKLFGIADFDTAILIPDQSG